MLDAITIKGKTITADALLTQREFANYLVGRGANYHFTVKGNQSNLPDDLVTLSTAHPKPPTLPIPAGANTGESKKDPFGSVQN